MLNSVAGATTGDLNNVLNAIDSLPAAANVQEAFKQISPEKAGALNLQMAPQNVSSVQTGVGCRLTFPFKVGSVILVPQAYAFYQHEFSNDSRGLDASLSQGSSTFTWQTEAAGKNFALVGASLTAGLRKNLYAQINYNSEVGRANATAQSITAGLRYEF